MTVLFVSAGPGAAREAFGTERRGAWADALPLALEKHGLFLETAGPDVLDEPEVFDRYPVVLVARQPEGRWTPEVAERARRSRGGVVVEGPLPPAVADQIGVTDCGPASRVGALQVVDGGLRASGARYGAAPGGRLGVGTSRPIALDDDRLWSSGPVPISGEQAAAWRTASWDARALAVSHPAVDVLADWIPADDAGARHAAIVGRDGLVGCSIGLFTFLGQSHTSAPYSGAEHRNWPSTISAEALLLGLVDLLHARAGRVRVRLLPWPSGAQWALTVRHDVDRPPDAAQLRAVLDGHRAAGTRATWYWRASNLRRGRRWARLAGGGRPGAALAEVTSSGHEVALHTERLWDGAEAERAALERAIAGPVAGTSAHGDPRCARFQGAPNILWADHAGLAYTELISHAHLHPHRFALLGPDGTITPSRVMCLPHHASFDRSMTSGDVAPQDVLDAVRRFAPAGGLLQVLNHPDLSRDELFELLSSVPAEGRWDVTAAEAARWWASTHVQGALTLERGPRALAIGSRGGVTGLQVQLLRPDGEASVVTIDVRPGEASVIAADG